jgi:hypothetical protein
MTKQEILTRIEQLRKELELLVDKQSTEKRKAEDAIKKCGKPEYAHLINPRFENGYIVLSYPNANLGWTVEVWKWAMKFIEQNPGCYPAHYNECPYNELHIVWSEYE